MGRFARQRAPGQSKNEYRKEQRQRKLHEKAMQKHVIGLAMAELDSDMPVRSAVAVTRARRGAARARRGAARARRGAARARRGAARARISRANGVGNGGL